MYKKLFLLFLILISQSLFGKSFSDDKYLQIVAQELETNNDLVEAKGDVVVYSPSFYITANRLIYNKKNSQLELFDDVTIIKDNQFNSFSQYAFLDMDKEETKLKPFLLKDEISKLWFNASSSTKDKTTYTLNSSTLSSCDCRNPAWSISFSEGDYDTNEKWVNTYNTRLYIKNAPIFYMPYFGFPTDKTRRTGLIRPKLGFSHREGFFYAQPIYFAPQKNYDIEYIPQIRIKRGEGHALKYRYADSRYSILSFEAAQFTEKKSYQEEMNLENQKHYGWDLEYKRDKLFSKSDSSDGFIVKSLDMNDVDYVNTKFDSDTTNYTNKFLESQIKYYYNTNNLYSDIELKLYNDISKDNNDDVMQTLPSINLHKFSNNIIFDQLSYSLDFKQINKTRDIGLGANTTQIYFPLSYHTSLFDDYLNLNISEQINFTNIQYSNNDKNFEDAQYSENNHIISLYTDLIRPYRNYIHTFKLDTTFTYSNNFLKEGDIYNLTNNDSDLNTFGITQTKKNFAIGFNQSIYNKSTLKEIIKHTIKQLYTHNETTNRYKASDLENDITFSFDYGSLDNRLTYNHDIKEILTSSTTLKLKHNDLFFNTYYNFKKDKTTLKSERTVNYDFGLDFAKYYKASYKEEYDITNNISKKKEYILDIDKKCWGINFKLVDSLVASNTTDNSILRQNILYMEFNLKQLFKLDQEHKFDTRKE